MHAYVLLLLFSKAVHIAQGMRALPTYLHALAANMQTTV